MGTDWFRRLATHDPVMPDPDRFVIGGAARLLSGLAIALLAGVLFSYGRGLEWGVAWVLYVPAAIALLPALTLVRRTTLRLVADPLAIEIETGWLFRRCWQVPLAGSSLESLTTAGLRTVVLHRPSGVEYGLASWLSRARADALLAWLDRVAPDGAWPRRARAAPSGDR